MLKMFFDRFSLFLFFVFSSVISTSFSFAQSAQDIEYMDDLSDMRLIVLLLVAFAFVIAFGLIYVVKSHRELKHQYTIIDKQKHEISEKNEELAFSNDSLEEMNIEKNNVLSVVAHDLKTPLGNIQGLVELMNLKKEMLNEDQKGYLTLITKVVSDGIGMVNNMLDVHKIEAELKEMVLVTTNVFDIIDKVIKLHEPAALAKDVQLNVEFDNRDLDINTDAQYLRQILSNLVSNAIKYTEAETAVDIKVVEGENSLEISVSDNGKGISNDQMKRLFAGYKITGKSEDEKAAPGFGLLITRRLVDKLKGKISVENKVTGKGAMFTVELLK
jgi:signal transduction histidine kinase